MDWVCDLYAPLPSGHLFLLSLRTAAGVSQH
jgi:hypothetical protein